MNFSGYVPLRRGILEHTMDSALTLQEYAALTVLIMNADKSTGAGKINGPVLRSYLPGLSADAAKRVLHSLEEKGYVFRQITPRSPLVYPYWVDKYCPTTGQHRALQLSIAKALSTQCVRDLCYVKPAPDSALDTSLEDAPDSALEGAHYNKKDKDKKLKKKNPSGSKDECATKSANSAQRVSTDGSTCGEGGAPQCATTAKQLLDDCSIPVPTLPAGYKLRDGDEGIGVYTPAGIRVSENIVPSLYGGHLQ